MEESEKNVEKAAELAAIAAFEMKIAEDTKAFLKELPKQTHRSPSKRILFISGIAAAIVIMVVSMVTINISHSDSAIAANYGINKIVSRTGENVSNSDFTDAVRAYYEKNYQESERLLTQVKASDKKMADFKDWLSILITLQTAGSSSDSFNKQIDKILSDEDHEFYFQAREMEADLNLFWRSLVIGK